MQGKCLGRQVMEGWFLIADRQADIRFGDIILMAGIGGVERGAKIFLGYSGDAFEVLMLDPIQVFRVRLEKLDLVCRVRAITRHHWRIASLKVGIRLHSAAYDHKLGLLAAAAEGKEIVCPRQ